MSGSLFREGHIKTESGRVDCSLKSWDFLDLVKDATMAAQQGINPARGR